MSSFGRDLPHLRHRPVALVLTEKAGKIGTIDFSGMSAATGLRMRRPWLRRTPFVGRGVRRPGRVEAEAFVVE